MDHRSGAGHRLRVPCLGLDRVARIELSVRARCPPAPLGQARQSSLAHLASLGRPSDGTIGPDPTHDQSDAVTWPGAATPPGPGEFPHYRLPGDDHHGRIRRITDPNAAAPEMLSLVEMTTSLFTGSGAADDAA